MDKVVHFEVPADDVKRAQNFYKSVFGWEIQEIPEMNYTIVRTVAVDEKHMPKEVGAINGGMYKRSPESPKGPTIVINVPSIDASIKKVEKAGGRAISPTKEIGGMGLYALVSDSEGNTIGIWQDIKKQ